jgi:heat-inducible transcriptional repressor
LTPKLSTGVFNRLDVVPLSSTRALFVISVKSGLVKTIVIEVDLQLNPERLNEVVAVLNERLSGLTLEQIRSTFADRVRDLHPDPTGLIGLVTRNASVIFDEVAEARRLSVGGRRNIVNLPEFKNPEVLQELMELLDDESVIVELIERSTETDVDNAAGVRIGDEIGGTKSDRYSVVAARYELGGTVGAIGVLGSTRMDYGKVIALVEQMATLLGRSTEEWGDTGNYSPETADPTNE